MSPREPLSVRADLLDVAPYEPSQRPARYRMNTNESPYPPPEPVLEAIASELRSTALNRYPDKDARHLFEALSRHVTAPVDHLWAANGSNEVFMHLFLAFGGPARTSMTFEPTYSLHTLIPRIAGTRTVGVPRGPDFKIDVSEAVRRVEAERPDIVLVCSPNNPSGGSEPNATVEALLAATPGLVVVDEAYAEFTDPSGLIEAIPEHPNLVVTRTLSKAWRLAGARLGYLVAHPWVIDGLRRVRLPYHLSTPTQIAGASALGHAHETLQAVRAIKGERDRISVELQAMGVKVWPSDSNFILFELDEPDRVWARLLERGVLVRNYSEMDGLERCLRVTAGRPEETEAFLGAMKEALDE